MNMPKKKLQDYDTSNITVVENMPDYSKDPYFVKKAENARKLLEKHPLPESFTRKKK
jgi:hypothetical protein